MAKIVNNTVARNAIEEYNKAYVAAIEQKPFETFLTDEEIQTKHLDAQKKALEYFFKHKTEDDESSSAILLNKLKAVGKFKRLFYLLLFIIVIVDIKGYQEWIWKLEKQKRS